MMTKPLTLTFNVPEGTDWPSERKRLAVALILEALARQQAEGAYTSTGGTDAYASEEQVVLDLLAVDSE